MAKSHTPIKHGSSSDLGSVEIVIGSGIQVGNIYLITASWARGKQIGW
mgnify:FL=1